MFGAHGGVGLLYSFARPVRRRLLGVRRAGMYERRRRVVHGVILSFTVNGGVCDSAPAHVRVGTGGKGTSLPIASLSVCVGWHRARVEA